jgi:hypothetical protein
MPSPQMGLFFFDFPPKSFRVTKSNGFVCSFGFVSSFFMGPWLSQSSSASRQRGRVSTIRINGTDRPYLIIPIQIITIGLIRVIRCGLVGKATMVGSHGSCPTDLELVFIIFSLCAWRVTASRGPALLIEQRELHKRGCLAIRCGLVGKATLAGSHGSCPTDFDSKN